MGGFLEEVKKTNKDVRWWTYAAWTLPLAAVSILVFLNIFGWTNLYDKAIVIVAVTFFSISVFWWWWALHRIYEVIRQLNKTDQKLDDIKEEFVKTRKVLRDL